MAENKEDKSMRNFLILCLLMLVLVIFFVERCTHNTSTRPESAPTATNK